MSDVPAFAEAPSPRAPREMWTELACARALLDALEAVLDAEHKEQTRCDVVAQVADQLVRLMSTLKQWETVGGGERARGTGQDPYEVHVATVEGRAEHEMSWDRKLPDGVSGHAHGAAMPAARAASEPTARVIPELESGGSP